MQGLPMCTKTIPKFLCGFWELNTNPCLYGKSFTEWDIFLAPIPALCILNQLASRHELLIPGEENKVPWQKTAGVEANQRPGIAGFQGGRHINIPYAKVSVSPARGFIARRNFTAEETSPRSQNLTPFSSTVRMSYLPCRVLSTEMFS